MKRLSVITTVVLGFLGFAQAHWPNAPYVDECSGRAQQACKNPCTYDTSQYPWCFNKKYLAKTPPGECRSKSDLVRKFFVFNFGVHLSEGTDQKFIYNVNVDDCARNCLRSAGIRPYIRCLSFDFYPFDQPEGSSVNVFGNSEKDWTQFPYEEKCGRGVCVLNSANKDSGRLRNEDQGYTDAELFYDTHFTHRSFMAEDGYYEVRDPRGGEIAEMLEYSGDSTFSTVDVWGMSRWGLLHLETPEPLSQSVNCELTTSSGTASNGEDAPEFYGGFTPVNEDQHCPGKLTKAETEALCAAAGGELCEDQSVIDALKGRKIGCSYDDFNMWSKADPPGNPPKTKFPRCCGRYRYLGGESLCSRYDEDAVKKCSSYTTASDCVKMGSGYNKQDEKGFGHLLLEFRQECEQWASDPFNAGQSCRGLVVQDWTPRDDCIWCLKPGENDGGNGGAGECRAGNDYGVCDGVEQGKRDLFLLMIKSQCEPHILCTLGNEYPDLVQGLSVTTKAPTPPTPAPTMNCNKYNEGNNKRSRCENKGSGSCYWDSVEKKCKFL